MYNRPITNRILTLVLCFAMTQMAYLQERETIKWTFLEKNIEDLDTIVRFEPYLLEVDFNDTIYIANPTFIRRFDELNASYNTLRDAVEANLPEAQRLLNSELTLAIAQLSDNVGLLENKYEMSLTENIKNTQLLREENYLIKKDLNNSLKELRSAKAKIRNERWNKIGSKLIWGVGGLLAGGLLIAVNN